MESIGGRGSICDFSQSPKEGGGGGGDDGDGGDVSSKYVHITPSSVTHPTYDYTKKYLHHVNKSPSHMLWDPFGETIPIHINHIIWLMWIELKANGTLFQN